MVYIFNSVGKRKYLSMKVVMYSEEEIRSY